MPGVTTRNYAPSVSRNLEASWPEEMTPVATQSQRAPGAGQHQRLNVAGKTEIAQVILVQAHLPLILA
jgi:hypothetical protein